jgi:putative endonuclease
MFFVYILKSKIKGAYYIGSCENISIRFNQHNKGLVKSTKRYLPWSLVYKESFDTLARARKRELQIKSWKSRRAIERIITF